MVYKWALSTNFTVLIFSLLAYIAWQTDATKPKPIDNMIELSKTQRITSLHCHVCHSESDEGCFNMTEYGENFTQKCSGEYHICVVKKFAFTSTDGNGTTSPMKTFSIKRNCTNRCENGSVVMGERTRLYVCSTCCTTPLCNTGSGSSSIHLVDKRFSFLTSVAHVNFFSGTLRRTWHLLELLSLLSLQFLI